MRLYALGAAGLALSSQAIASYLLFFYVEVLGVPVGAAMAVRTAAMLVELVLSPLWGHLSDRTGSRLGRRRPWLIAVGPAAAVLFALAFHPPAVVPPVVWLGVAGFGLDVAHSILWTNQSALFPELFPDGPTRARAAAWRQGLLLTGYLVAIVPTPMVYGTFGFGGMGLIYALAGAGLTSAAAVFLPEAARPAAAGRPGLRASLRRTITARGVWTTLPALALVQLAFVIVSATMPFYARYALGLGDAGTSALLLAMFGATVPALALWARAARAAAPVPLYGWAVLLCGLGLGTAGLAPGVAAAAAGGVLVGAGFGGVLVLGELVMARLVDAQARDGHVGGEGILYSLQAFSSRVLTASLMAPLLGVLDPLFGYVSRDQPGPQPGTAFRFAMCGAPAAVMFLAAVLLRSGRRRGG